MTTESKAREFFIQQLSGTIISATRNRGYPDDFHVIEKSYADQLEAENKKLREAMQFAVDHLSSMDDYSIVNGAIHSLKEALSSGGE